MSGVVTSTRIISTRNWTRASSRWRGRMVELVAGADDVGCCECCQEHRDIALADVVAVAELRERREEALAGIEPDTEGPAGGQLVAVHADPGPFRSPQY